MHRIHKVRNLPEKKDLQTFLRFMSLSSLNVYPAQTGCDPTDTHELMTSTLNVLLFPVRTIALREADDTKQPNSETSKLKVKHAQNASRGLGRTQSKTKL